MRKYLSLVMLSGVISWLAWFVVVWRLDPYGVMGLALTFFFLTLFIALSCTFGIMGFYFRLWFFKNEIFYKHVTVSLRQGVFLSMIAIFCLIFQLMRVLTWWSGLLLVVISVLLEFYFSSLDSDYV